MIKLFNFLTTQLPAKIGILVLLGLTTATSVTGIVRVARSFETKDSLKTEIPQVKVSESEKETDVTVTTVPQVLVAQVSTTSNSIIPTVIPTKTPTPVPTPKLALAGGSKLSGVGMPISNTNNTNACIVTLFGKQYDVTPLKGSHPGGDIFTCNTDMTVVYQGQHGTNVSRMLPYLVTSSGNSGGSTNPTPAPTTRTGRLGSEDSEGEEGSEIEDEREDETKEHREDLEHDLEKAKEDLEDE